MVLLIGRTFIGEPWGIFLFPKKLYYYPKEAHNSKYSYPSFVKPLHPLQTLPSPKPTSSFVRSIESTFDTMYTFPSCSLFPPNKSLIFNFSQNSFLRLHMTTSSHDAQVQGGAGSFKTITPQKFA
jgi:hypothetical protein